MSRSPITHEDMKEYGKIKFRRGKTGKRSASFVFRVTGAIVLIAAAAAGAVGIFQISRDFSVLHKEKKSPRSPIAIIDDSRPLTQDFLYSGGKSSSAHISNGADERKLKVNSAAEKKAESHPSDVSAAVPKTSQAKKKSTPHPVSRERQQAPRSWEPVSTGYLGSGAAYVAGVRDLVLVYKEYPAEARKMGLEGQCLLVCVIRRNGSLKHVEIVKSSGHTLLDRQALNAVRSVGRFPPVPSSLPGDEISVDIPFSFYVKSTEG